MSHISRRCASSTAMMRQGRPRTERDECFGMGRPLPSESIPGLMQIRNSEAIVLLSGGLDSAACAHLLQQSDHKVRGLFLAYGQAAAEPERRAASHVAQHLRFPLSELTMTGSVAFGPGELTGRNATFVFAALLFSRPTCGSIVLGVHAGTPYYDCSPAFVAADRLVAEHTDGRVRLLAPAAQLVEVGRARLLSRRRDPAGKYV
jgi:7-cyano-7-deazaguanine synthase